MSLPDFLVRLRASPALQRLFFVESRQGILRALASHNPGLPHPLLEDACAQALGQLLEGTVSGFRSPHEAGSEAFRRDLVRYLALVVAQRRLRDILRKRRREISLSELRANEDEAPDESVLLDSLQPPDEADPVGDGVARAQTLGRLQRCIEHLTPKLRDVVQGLVEDLTQAETAASLGIPEGTVKSRMSEAIRKLKRCMGIAMEMA